MEHNEYKDLGLVRSWTKTMPCTLEYNTGRDNAYWRDPPTSMNSTPCVWLPFVGRGLNEVGPVAEVGPVVEVVDVVDVEEVEEVAEVAEVAELNAPSLPFVLLWRRYC